MGGERVGTIIKLPEPGEFLLALKVNSMRELMGKSNNKSTFSVRMIESGHSAPPFALVHDHVTLFIPAGKTCLNLAFNTSSGPLFPIIIL